MVRLIILILALNAFIFPVSAMGVYEMMGESNTAMMTSTMSGATKNMNCEMATDKACCSAECANNCSEAIEPLIFSAKQNLFIVAGNQQPLAGFAYFYKIILPVNTPPPLI